MRHCFKFFSPHPYPPTYLSSPPYTMVWPHPLPELPELGLLSQKLWAASSLPSHPLPPGTPTSDWLLACFPLWATLSQNFPTCVPLEQLSLGMPAWSSQMLHGAPRCSRCPWWEEVLWVTVTSTSQPLCSLHLSRPSGHWPLGREPRQDGWPSLKLVAGLLG